MDGEGVNQFVPLFQTLVWGSVVIIIFVFLRKEVKDFIHRVSGSDEIQMSLGSLKIEAKAMREVQRSLDLGFSDEMIEKRDIEALIETKIKSIQSAMEHAITKGDIRSDLRKELNAKIKITREDGSIIEGMAMDISEAGIGFRSNQQLKFNEVVEIKPANTNQPLQILELLNMQIVRIERAVQGFNYGAKLVG